MFLAAEKHHEFDEYGEVIDYTEFFPREDDDEEIVPFQKVLGGFIELLLQCLIYIPENRFCSRKSTLCTPNLATSSHLYGNFRKRLQMCPNHTQHEIKGYFSRLAKFLLWHIPRLKNICDHPEFGRFLSYFGSFSLHPFRIGGFQQFRGRNKSE
jgi:hypothetical protein